MNKLLNIVLLSFATLFYGNAQASSVTTLVGDTVSFTFDSALMGLFGQPGVLGDTLVFTPTTFSASAPNNSGVVINNATVNIQAQALTPNHWINTVSVTERGNYFSFGNSTVVGVSGLVGVLSATPTITSPIVPTVPFTQTGFLQTKLWEANAALNPASLASLGSGSLNITIDNLLGAISTTHGQAAFINKLYAGLTVTAVPLPASIWLLGAALVGLISTSKRKLTA